MVVGTTSFWEFCCDVLWVPRWKNPLAFFVTSAWWYLSYVHIVKSVCFVTDLCFLSKECVFISRRHSILWQLTYQPRETCMDFNGKWWQRSVEKSTTLIALSIQIILLHARDQSRKWSYYLFIAAPAILFSCSCSPIYSFQVFYVFCYSRIIL